MFIDYDHQILPNVITLPGVLAGIAASSFQDAVFYRDLLTVRLAEGAHPEDSFLVLPWIGSALGCVIGGGILLGVGSLYQALRKKQGLGMGDVKMMAMVGAFLGWRMAFLTIFAGSMAGSAIGAYLVLKRGETMQSKLPFGVFLGLGALLALFLGIPFVDWYTRL
jgi:leader peptidase (prepilin peptidase)/N-methyltransferase